MPIDIFFAGVSFFCRWFSAHRHVDFHKRLFSFVPPWFKKQDQKNNVNPNKNKHEFQTEHSLKIYVLFFGFYRNFWCNACPHQAGPSASTLRVWVAPFVLHWIWWNLCMDFVGEIAHMNAPVTCWLRHLCGCNMGRFPCVLWNCAICGSSKHDQTARTRLRKICGFNMLDRTLK